MKPESPVIEVTHLARTFGRTEAVNDLSLRVGRGQCYGFFGRNGAGKTTTIKCLLNLLKPSGGSVHLFGLDPEKNEVAVKSRLAYVPDYVAFYPWMTVRHLLDYLASFRPRWNRESERALLAQFQVDETRKTSALSKGQKTQLALIGAICAEPELLILDEPTSGLDPIVRREFIETVIGAFQEADPENRTVFVSTHLISEFEGLIDEFTIIENGHEMLTLEADQARAQYKKIRARFAGEPPIVDFPFAKRVRRNGRELELTVNGHSEEVLQQLQSLAPEALAAEALSLEEIFVTSLERSAPMAGPQR